MRWPIPGVSALVVHNGRVLLVRRAKEPYSGFWSLPGGAVELGETSRNALVREVFEETSVEVEPTEVVGVRDIILQSESSVSTHYIVITFRAAYVRGTPTPGSDVSEAGWFDCQEALKMELTEGLSNLIQTALCD